SAPRPPRVPPFAVRRGGAWVRPSSSRLFLQSLDLSVGSRLAVHRLASGGGDCWVPLASHAGAPAPGRAAARTPAPRRPAARTTTRVPSSAEESFSRVFTAILARLAVSY